jgi:rubrerythrin
MDPEAFTESIREECATELERLGSEKALVAATDAQLDRERVLAAAAAAETRAAETFERWADDEGDDGAREAFEQVAATEREHAERVRDRMDEGGSADAADPDALHDYLRGLDGTAGRIAAGLIARPMVASRSLLQTVNFFVNESEESTADLFRDLRTETEDLIEEGGDLLTERCEGEDDRDRAREAAVEAIERAYEEYADSLEGMGIDPKPVC